MFKASRTKTLKLLRTLTHKFENLLCFCAAGVNAKRRVTFRATKLIILKRTTFNGEISQYFWTAETFPNLLNEVFEAEKKVAVFVIFNVSGFQLVNK